MGDMGVKTDDRSIEGYNWLWVMGQVTTDDEAVCVGLGWVTTDAGGIEGLQLMMGLLGR